MFEDDIEVAKDYFDYILTSLSRHVFRAGPRSTDYHSSHLMGISLTTPRYDETSIPRKPWTPSMEIGDEPFFQFQLAGSWGALYFPWAWRSYLEYYHWRKRLELPKKIDVIPFSYVNIWERSWKRYLQELMFITGTAMLYPNFANQTSFSTHHRELGEHTQGKPEVPLVDALGTNNLPIFTVPLITDSARVRDLLASMKDLEDLPVVNFYHNRTDDIYSLAELGVGSADVLREFGFNLAHYNPNPSCILDWARPLKLARKKEAFLSFIPQGSILQQLEQLRNALAMAHSLNRILVVPDFVLGGQPVAPGEVLSADHLYSAGPVTVRKSTGATPDRLVAFHPFDSRGKRPAIVSNALSNVRHILLPLSHGTDMDIYRWFHMCHDELLMFSRLDNAFSQYVNLTDNSLFDEFIEDTLVPAPALSKLVDGFEYTKDMICVEYYRPDEDHCKRPKYDYKYWRSVHYRNCNATADKVLSYGAAWIPDLRLANVTSIYLINAPRPSMHSHRAPSGDLLTVLTKTDLAKFKLPDALIPFIEEELCAQAPFYLGNAYSLRSKRILSKRKDRLTALLGMGIVAPFRNETLPGLD